MQKAVGQGVEQPRHYNDGLALWIVRWTVEFVSGTLTFDRCEDDAGNVVMLVFDRID